MRSLGVEMKQGADLRLRAGALAFATAAVMNIPAIFSIHPPTDPGHNREFAMGANTASYRLATTLQIYALIPVIFGMIALYAILATTPARRWAMASLVLTISGAGLALPGGGFAAVVMPAAGVLLSQGVEENVVALLDQVYREPALIAVFLGGLLYNAGLLITSVAVWRSGAFPRWMAVLVAATAIIGTATFLDVSVAAFLALAAGISRKALPKTPSQ
jgi:hypothetical protein